MTAVRYRAWRPGVYGILPGAAAPHREPVPVQPGTRPRNDLPCKPYVYRGTGYDTLTAFMDDEPEVTEPLPPRRERLELVASLRLNDGPVSGQQLPHGTLTAAQAAELLGVTRRTIERYKRELRVMEQAS